MNDARVYFIYPYHNIQISQSSNRIKHKYCGKKSRKKNSQKKKTKRTFHLHIATAMLAISNHKNRMNAGTVDFKQTEIVCKFHCVSSLVSADFCIMLLDESTYIIR